MMSKKIIINGGTGLIGKKLTHELLKRDYKVVILTRDIDKAKSRFEQTENIEFINSTALKPIELSIIFDSARSVINLAGESLGKKRWNKKFKKILYDSRINTTQNIIDAMALCKIKPESFICSSAIGYYGASETNEFTELSPPGSDFLSNLCICWETTALKANKIGIRTVCIRTGIVLDRYEGALNKLILPFKLFLGGKQGSGKQWVSWIHINDIIGLIILAIENPNINSILNATASNPVTNDVYCKTIGKVLHRPSFLTVPGFVLRLLIGEFAKYILTGQKVMPAVALRNGYKFEFDNIYEAVKDILKSK
jgi:uncharacterized protein